MESRSELVNRVKEGNQVLGGQLVAECVGKIILGAMKRVAISLLGAVWVVFCGGSTPPELGSVLPGDVSDLAHSGEVHLRNVIQLTRGQGENAEAYWSFDGKQLVFQTTSSGFQR